MISKECFEEEWIEKVCSTHRFRHPALVEKVIRAFSLLEMLVKHLRLGISPPSRYKDSEFSRI